MAWTQTNGGVARRRLLSMVAMGVLAACGGGGSGGDGDTAVEALRQGSRSASCSSITHVEMAVTGVRFARGGRQDFSSPRTIDLLAPQAGVLQALGLAPLGPSDATQLRLLTADGTVRFSSDATATLKVPGGTTVSVSTSVATGTLADLVVPSFDPCAALHMAGNSGQWLLTGNVAAQLRPLTLLTTPQVVAGPFRPLPGDGFATVQANGSGGFVVQRFDSFTNAVGGPVTITLPLGPSDTSPTLTPLASGYLGTWLGPNLNPQQPQANSFPLFTQLLDASGHALGAPVQVAITTPSVSREVPASLPQAAALPDGGAALVWVQLRSGSLDVFLQRFSATGTVGSPRQVNVTTSQGLPTVVGQDNGNVLVVWGAGSLFARVFAANGTAGAQQAIAPDAGSLSGIAAVSPTPGGGAAVAWEKGAALGPGTVLLERLGPDGAPVAGPQPVVGIPPAVPGQSSPAVGVLADGSAVVAWVEAGIIQVVARRFATDNTALGDPQVILGSHTVAPVVVPLPWGGFVIEASSPAGFLARLFDAQGLKD